LLVFGLAAVVCAAEPIKGSTSQRLDSIEAKLQPLYSKTGIYFGGNFYSRALSSKLSGNVTDSATAKTTEDALYTGLDLSVNARPLDAIGGTAIIRMHNDWRNMFGSMANPLTLRWISIDGNAKDFFVYNIGDFAQKYTKLTLWLPEPEIMFEPTVFARQREIAMDEEFLGGNNRILQGANFNFGAKVAPALQELRIRGFATRLRQTGKQLGDADYETPQGFDSYGVDMDRYAVSSNLNLGFVPGTQLGGTFLYIGDAARTSKLDDIETYENPNDPNNYVDKNTVFSINAGLGSGLFSAIDSEKVKFGLSGEFAGSNGRKYFKKDSSEAVFGTALKGGLDGNFKFGKNGLNIDLGFLMNSSNFRNELAQSPALFKVNILNTMNHNSFNIFDALYTNVFSYTPAQGEEEDGEEPVGGIKHPIKKSAWTRGTLTWDEILRAYKKGLIEQDISGALPFGEATPNRRGFVGGLKLDFIDKAILLGGDLKILSEPYYDTTFLGDFEDFEENKGEKMKRKKFTEFAGGASFNVAKFGNWWAYPFILSGSFKKTSVSNYLGLSGYDKDISFINGGLYWKFWKRAGLMGGYQLVSSKSEVSVSDEIYKMTSNQSQWAAGFEYTVAEGGVLNATIGQVIVNNSINGDQKMKDDESKNNYKALRLDLNLTVKF